MARTKKSHPVVWLLAISAVVVCARSAASESETPASAVAKGAVAVATAPASRPAATPSRADATPGAAPVAVPSAIRTTAAATKPAPRTWVVTRIVDGDTIHVVAGAGIEKIRLIGIDSPEIGECGHASATDRLRRIINGQRVVLVAGASTNRDRYGRLLRYVDVGGVDAGLAEIKSGHAIARYDSRDGYGRHPRETQYVTADRRSPAADGCGEPGDPATAPVPIRPSNSWPLAGDRFPCPQSRPIKGNESSMIAHRPGDQSYLITNPEQCFATMTQAISAGFRPAKR